MIARNNNGQGHCSFPDRNGNVSVVLDFNGGTLESYRSDDFGVPTFYNGGGTMLTESGISNALLYTGREWNQTFGLYEYRARGCDPKLGRFLSEDPKASMPAITIFIAIATMIHSIRPIRWDLSQFKALLTRISLYEVPPD